ncbi:PWWP domain-containing DNA repair factor 3B isoform X3 [Epinephelus fuscoguttatus]|uniref:PWWP domain-containing DNA repair factor 3B isoform X3 n=1 Tax=Epinephelus fuscoguttatus TaxID=293821 RepID=UPI0020D07708|nr:PWWP domain-containing DNA repair factor 3B isoform X3 [Epinephelus fuscoguttatus]
MKGGSRRTRKGEPKKTLTKKTTTQADAVSFQGTEESNAVPGNHVAIVSQSTASSLPSTPKRGRGRKRRTQEALLTSTPVHSSSTDILSNISESPHGANQAELEYTEVITQLKTSEVDSPRCKSKSQSRSRSTHASQPRQVRKGVTKEQTRTYSKTNGPPAKRWRGRTRKVEKGTEESNAVPGNHVAIVSQSTASSSPSTPKRGRGRKRRTQEALLTSTPVHSSSTDILSNISESSHGANQAELEYTEVITQLKTSEVDSPRCKSKSQSRSRRTHAFQPRQVRKGVTKEQTQTCSKTNGPPAKRWRGRTRKVEKGTEELSAVPGNHVANVSQSTVSSSPSTPKRGRGRKRRTQEALLTSTPVHSSSTDILSNISESPHGANQAELEYTEVITQLKTSEVDSPHCKSKSQSRSRSTHASQLRQVRKGVTKEQTQTCSKTNGPPAKPRRGRTRKVGKGNLQKDSTTQSFERSRPRFELKTADTAEQDESLLSSDLSIELSCPEEQLPSLDFPEDEGSDEEEDEDEELPSFLMQSDKKPPSITEGVFVWHKFRHYPFWPALVKSVHRKQKKASIMLIDDPMIHKKKGFTVPLKTLKPFDCEEADQLVLKAKEEYDSAIVWSLDLISDYRIRIACGSFSGSFLEYFAHDMSYPVRRTYPQAASERLTITTDLMMEAPCDDHKEDSFSEQHEEVSRSSKRLLPDRSHAAHNRANEKLVHFIVKQRMVEGRLLAVIRGQQQSRWLCSFLSSRRRRVVNIYLEDDQQLDQVYWYLSELYATAVATAPCLAEMKSIERVPFVLDVLLPEAIIYAIAGVDNVSVKKAEEKYLKGRCISHRERQEFDLMIERQIRKKSQHQNTSLVIVSDPIS